MSKKKRVIQSGIEAQDEYYRQRNAQEAAEEERRKNDPLRPNILKRFGSILLDGLMIGVVFFGLFMLSYHTVLPAVGYQATISNVKACYKDSGLYYETESGGFDSLTDHLDNTKNALENYDPPITNYYTVNTRAVKAECYKYYCNSKLESGLFEKDAEGNIVRKSDSTENQMEDFFLAQYNTAVAYQKKDPIITQGNNYTLLTMVANMMACSILSTSIFYLIIPLTQKEGETLGQKVFKLCLVNEEDRGQVKKKQIVIRYFVVLLTTYILPCSLYIMWSWALGLPIFVNAGMVAFKKNQGSFHDFFSKTVIINKRRSDAFEMLKAMQNQPM